MQQVKRYTIAAPLDMHQKLGQLQAEAEAIRFGGDSAKFTALLTDGVIAAATYTQMANDKAYLAQVAEVSRAAGCFTTVDALQTGWAVAAHVASELHPPAGNVALQTCTPGLQNMGCN